MRACRTCLSKHHLYHIFDTFESNSDQLCLVTGVQISRDDGLPQTICKSCMKIITKTLHLRELSLSADQFLRSIITESVIKHEINENQILQKDPFSADDLDSPLENFVNQSVHELSNSSVTNKDNLSIHSNISEESNKSVIKNHNNDENVAEDDVKHEIESNKTSEYEQMPETEFVDIQTKEEHVFERNVEVRNCKKVKKESQIALYSKNVNNIDRILKEESCRKLQKMLSIVTSRSSELTRKELTKERPTKSKIATNQQTEEKHVTKGNADRTLLKNKRKSESANGLSHMPKSKLANLNSQRTKIPTEEPTEAYNPFDKAIELSCKVASVSFTGRKSKHPTPILYETVIPTVKSTNVIGQAWNALNKSDNSYSYPTNSFGQLADVSQLTDSNALHSLSSSSSLYRITNMLGQSNDPFAQPVSTLIAGPNSMIRPDRSNHQTSKRPTRLAKQRCLANLSQSANDVEIDESSVELGNDFSDTDDIYEDDVNFTSAKLDETNDLTDCNHPKGNMLCKLNKDEYFSKGENLFEDSHKYGKTQIKLRESCKIHTQEKVTVKKQNNTTDDKAKSLKQQELFKQLMSDLTKKITEYDTYIGEKQTKTNFLPGRKRPKLTSEQRQEANEKRAKLMALAVNGNAMESLECSICHDVLKTRASFKTHALKHFERQFVCKFPGCGKTFALRWGLLRHEQNRHGVKKRLGCTECAFRAADRTTINNHVRAEHTGERPYECNECGTKFRMRNNIIQHIRQVHFRPGKTYQCEFCAVRCSCRRELWTHQDKKHNFLHTFYCYLCDNKYKSYCATKKHIMKRHGVPNDQVQKIARTKTRRHDAPSTKFKNTVTGPS